MAFEPGPNGWPALALRFAAFQSGVTSVLVGTTNLEHLAGAVRSVDDGPLPESTVGALSSAFERHGRDWFGVI